MNPESLRTPVLSALNEQFDKLKDACESAQKFAINQDCEPSKTEAWDKVARLEKRLYWLDELMDHINNFEPSTKD